MKLPISDRLLACCREIRPGERIADIGCDHGYLSIWLLSRGIARSAIAADLRPGPLESARTNARRYGVDGQIEFVLCDGVSAVPRDFDCLVCAGMGAETMVSILQAAPWLRDSRYRLVLQCQTKTYILRRYLSENGWQIEKESVLRDGKFLYTVITAVQGQGPVPLSPGECFLSPALLEQTAPEAEAYFRWIYAGLSHIVISRGSGADPFLIRARNDLEQTARARHISLTKEEAL